MSVLEPRKAAVSLKAMYKVFCLPQKQPTRRDIDPWRVLTGSITVKANRPASARLETDE
jgi:hypothetical protein